MDPFLVCFACYLVSVLLSGLHSLLTLRAWRAGYFHGRQLPEFARWHPVLAAHWYGGNRPRRAPAGDDMTAFAWIALLPVLNSAVFLSTLLAVAIFVLPRAVARRVRRLVGRSSVHG